MDVSLSNAQEMLEPSAIWLSQSPSNATSAQQRMTSDMMRAPSINTEPIRTPEENAPCHRSTMLLMKIAAAIAVLIGLAGAAIAANDSPRSRDIAPTGSLRVAIMVTTPGPKVWHPTPL
jgi:hypothetical protein